MPIESKDKIQFKLMKWGNFPKKDTSKVLFYADYVGIHPKTIERGNLQNSLDLLNLLGSDELMYEFFRGKSLDLAEMKYILPARISTYDKLCKVSKYYKKFVEIIKENMSKFEIMELHENCRDWLKKISDQLKEKYSELLK